MRRNSYVCILVLLVLSAFLFSGCGGSGGPLFSNLENDDPTYQQPDDDTLPDDPPPKKIQLTTLM